MGGKTKSILIFLFIIGFLVYLATNQTPASKVKSLKLSDVFHYFGKSKQVVNSEKTPSTISSKKPSISPDEIPFGFSQEKLSPYFKKVKLEIAKTVGNQKQFVFLKTNLQNKEKVNISGWQLKTNSQISTPILWGIKYYDPFGYSKKEPIVLEAGDFAYLYFADSPVGQNFRLNKCSGYLNNSFQFNPPLPKNCPFPSRREFSFLSGRCQSFILSLKQCDTVSPAEIRTFSRPEELSCRIYLEEFNYKSCYNEHYLDPDFLSHEWRIWLNRPLQLDPEHDRLLLFDEKGLLVDEYIY